MYTLRVNRRLLSLVAVVAGVGWTDVLPAQELPNTAVTIVVDMSESFAPLQPQDSTALEAIADALSTMAQTVWEQPVQFYWTTVQPYTAPAPCGPPMSYRQQIVERPRPGALTSAKSMRAWLAACILKLTGQGAVLSNYTEISGALRIAADGATGTPGPKIVIILSDFDEDLPPGQQPVAFELSSENVVMVYRDEGDQNSLFARLDDWERRLEQANASSVCRLAVQIVSEATVRQCLVQQ